MGFLSNLVDDALDATVKVIKSTMRVGCAILGDHFFEWGREHGEYRCMCGASKK